MKIIIIPILEKVSRIKQNLNNKPKIKFKFKNKLIQIQLNHQLHKIPHNNNNNFLKIKMHLSLTMNQPNAPSKETELLKPMPPIQIKDL
jgi:hypothetical protein